VLIAPNAAVLAAAVLGLERDPTYGLVSRALARFLEQSGHFGAARGDMTPPSFGPGAFRAPAVVTVAAGTLRDALPLVAPSVHEPQRRQAAAAVERELQYLLCVAEDAALPLPPLRTQPRQRARYTFGCLPSERRS